MKVPIEASVEVQQAFREIWAELHKIPVTTEANPFEIDLRGSRVTNAGHSISKRDYVTRAELDQFADSVVKKRSSVQSDGSRHCIAGCRPQQESDDDKGGGGYDCRRSDDR